MVIDFKEGKHEPSIVDIKARQMELQVLLKDYAIKNTEYRNILKNRIPASMTTAPPTTTATSTLASTPDSTLASTLASTPAPTLASTLDPTTTVSTADAAAAIGIQTTIVSDQVAVMKAELDAMKLAIIQKLNVISGLIQNVYPKGIENQSTITANNPIIIAHLNDLKTIYAEVEEIVHDQDKMEGNLEDRQLSYTSNFYNYLIYFVITIIAVVSLFYIYSSPDAGRLDTVILLLGLAICGYYTYLHGVDKIKIFIDKIYNKK